MAGLAQGNQTPQSPLSPLEGKPTNSEMFVQMLKDPERLRQNLGVLGFAGAISSGPFKGLTVAEKLERQGGTLASKPGIDRLTRVLDDHGMEWQWHPSGNGITAYSEVVDQLGRVSKEGKHFNEKTSLRTLRDWLGY